MPSSSSTASTGWTWARARLRLGQSNVGFWVLASLWVLTQGVRPAAGDTLAQLQAWAGWVGLWVALQLPFDVLGGYLLPERFGRPTAGAGGLWGWALAWLRGVVVQAGLAVAYGGALIAATAVHPLLGIALLGVAALALLRSQGTLVQWTAGARAQAPDEGARKVLRAAGLDPWYVDVIDTGDSGFVGGWVGLPGSERLMLPLAWALDDRKLGVQAVRRQAARVSGARRRGAYGALAFHLTGAVVVLVAVPGASLASAAGLVQFAMGCTLWGFVGLLTLPTTSRAAVMALDAVAVQRLGAHEVWAVTELLDADQEAEPARGETTGRIFHPVSTPAARRAGAPTAPSAEQAWWRLTRTGLFLSWATLSPLSRAVHCNAGRPELWALLPGD